MRFIKVFIPFIITVLVPYITTTAQTLHSKDVFAEKKHRISIDAGLANYTNRDDLTSPLLYKGYDKTIAFSYTYKGKKNWHWVQVHIMTGEIQTSSLRNLAEHYYGQLQYGYARLLSGGSRTFWVGGSWGNMGSVRRYSPFSGTILRQRKEITATTLNINLLYELLSEKRQRLVLSLSSPVLSYLERDGYVIGSLNHQLTSLNSYQRFQFSSLYERPLSAYFKLRLTYWFLYQRYSQPRKTISVFHGLSGGISFQF